MGSARTGAIALAAGCLALPINAAGASSDTDAYCDLAEDFHDHLQDTFELQELSATDDTEVDRERLDDELELAEATTHEYILEMVEIAPVEARAALRILAEEDLVDVIEFELEVEVESVEASVEEACGFSLFEIDLPNGRTFNVATGKPRLDLRRGIDQIKPAIEAVRTEVGADVLICIVNTFDASVYVVALDESTNSLFHFEEGELIDFGQPDDEFGGCASADDVLSVDIAILHDFFDEHPETAALGIFSYTGEEVVPSGESITHSGEPVYWANVPTNDGLVRFHFDPQTGETVGTFDLDPPPPVDSLVPVGS